MNLRIHDIESVSVHTEHIEADHGPFATVTLRVHKRDASQPFDVILFCTTAQAHAVTVTDVLPPLPAPVAPQPLR